MIKLQLSLELDYEVSAPGCDFIFNIPTTGCFGSRAARQARQTKDSFQSWERTSAMQRELTFEPGPRTGTVGHSRSLTKGRFRHGRARAR